MSSLTELWKEKGARVQTGFDKFLRWVPSILVILGAVGVYIGDHQILLAHDTKLLAWERNGTPAMVKHEARDDERIEAIKHRLDLLEQIITSLPEIRVEIGKISVKVDAVQKEIEQTRETLKLTKP